MKFKLKIENHEWDASILVDKEDKPILRLFEDDQLFESLFEASSHKILHYRNERKNLFKGRAKKTSYKVLHDGHEILIDCQYDSRNSVTSLISGKRKEIRTGKKLKDRSQYPISLVIPQHNLKLHMNLGADDDIFVLYTNAVNFLALPYKYDLKPDKDPDIKFEAHVELGKRKIKMPFLWSNSEFI